MKLPLNSIFNSFKLKNQTDAIYTDFSKAFDSVDHVRLTSKLENFGITGILLEWIKSYHTDRLQFVRVRGEISHPFKAVSGVPQGSNLGPILFIIFANDIPNVIKHSEVLLFADDVKLYKTVKTILDASLLQKDIEALENWTLENGLKLNAAKCFVVSFSKIKEPILFDYKISNLPLSRKTEIKDLGVWLDAELTFSTHIDYIAKTASKTVGFITRNSKNFKNIRTIINVYKTLVTPIFMYASTVWVPSTKCNLDRLESIQHRILRYISSKTNSPMSFYSHNYYQISKRCEIFTIKSLLATRDLTVMWKIMHDSINSPDLRHLFRANRQVISTRNNPPLIREAETLGYICNSPIPRLTVAWNTTHRDTREIDNYITFKNTVRRQNKQYYNDV